MTQERREEIMAMIVANETCRGIVPADALESLIVECETSGDPDDQWAADILRDQVGP